MHHVTNWAFLVALLTLTTACVAPSDDGVDSDERLLLEEIVAEFSGGGIPLRDALADADLVDFGDINRSMSGQKPPPLPPVGLPTFDDDGDGHTEQQGDCDDSRADVYPGAEERCDGDGVDNDCDGGLAPGADPDPVDGYFVGPDQDGDGAAHPSNRFQACGMMGGSASIVEVTPTWADCDDSDPLTRPYGAETLDGADNNCDGPLRGRGQAASAVDEHVGEIPCFADNDGDWFGGPSPVTWAVGQCPPGTVNNRRDCNDADWRISPTRREHCDGIDQNCDGRPDNAQRPPRNTWWSRGTGALLTIWYGPCTMDDLGYDPN